MQRGGQCVDKNTAKWQSGPALPRPSAFEIVEKFQKEYAAAGMVAEDIKLMCTYDWEVFLSLKNYESHTHPLPDTYFFSECKDDRSPLFRKFASLTTTFDEEDFPDRYIWTDTIGDANLSLKLKTLSAKDLELLS